MSWKTAVSNGDVIGRIQTDTAGFWALMPDQESYNPGKIQLLNNLPGNPVSVAVNGDIIVQNANAIDYETLPKLTLRVTTRQGNTQSDVVDVVINVKNGNDNPPVAIVESMDAVNLENGESIEINAAQHFAEDIDGDVLTYSAEGLPEGITIDAATGFISGSSTTAGSYDVMVSASDGVAAATVSLALTIAQVPVNEAPQKKSSGSLFVILLGLVGITLGRRKLF